MQRWRTAPSTWCFSMSIYPCCFSVFLKFFSRLICLTHFKYLSLKGVWLFCSGLELCLRPLFWNSNSVCTYCLLMKVSQSPLSWSFEEQPLACWNSNFQLLLVGTFLLPFHLLSSHLPPPFSASINLMHSALVGGLSWYCEGYCHCHSASDILKFHIFFRV